MPATSEPWLQRAANLAGRIGQAPFAWCLLATLFIAVRQLGLGWQDLVGALGDTDDATRLVAVREFMAGAPWFDTSLPRFGGDTPYVSHWSRLIDLPLAALLTLFGAILAPERAELAVRILWPTLVLGAFFVLFAREAEIRGGRIAAAAVLVFGVCASSGIAQFIPGRIDHHNVQITCAVIGLLMLARALQNPRAGIGAGLLLGLGLAVGYEAIALVIPGLALAAALAAFDRRWTAGASQTATAFAATLAVAVAATIPPAHWMVQTCDSLSTNLVLLAAAGAIGLQALSRAPARLGLVGRLAILGVAGLAGLAAFGIAEPACLRGPFGQVDPAVNAIWLDKVQEAQNILWLYGHEKSAFLGFVACGALGIVAAAINWRRDRSIDQLFILMLVPLSLGLAVWQVKLISYATWLPTLPIALMAISAPKIQEIPARTVRLAAMVLCNQSTLALFAGAMFVLFGGGAETQAAKAKSETPEAQLATNMSCFTDASMAALARLPAGRFAADTDLGPFLVARTQHTAIAAPYHRLDRQILAIDAIFQSAPAQARMILSAYKADYLAACITAGEIKSNGDKGENPAGLRATLRAGGEVAFLEPIATGAKSTALHVWRIVKADRP